MMHAAIQGDARPHWHPCLWLSPARCMHSCAGTLWCMAYACPPTCHPACGRHPLPGRPHVTEAECTCPCIWRPATVW